MGPQPVEQVEHGALHLTHSANNLGAEFFMAASATVRRTKLGAELTQAIPLITCARYGNEDRNSDPKIGIEVNALARAKRMVTLANPVGLYMAAFDGAGITLNGHPAGDFPGLCAEVSRGRSAGSSSASSVDARCSVAAFVSARYCVHRPPRSG